MQQTRLTLTPNEAAAELRVGKTKIYELLRKGMIPSLRVGRKILIPTDELKKWLYENAHINGNLPKKGNS